jgi:hypothetical protein
VGTILFYRHDTWHRGTPITSGAMRVVQNLTFRNARKRVDQHGARRVGVGDVPAIRAAI